MTIEIMKFENAAGTVRLQRLDMGWYRVQGWSDETDVVWSQTLATLDEAERYYNKKLGELL